MSASVDEINERMYKLEIGLIMMKGLGGGK